MFHPLQREAYSITPYNQLNEIYDAPEIDSELYHTMLSQEDIRPRPNMPDEYCQTPELLQQLILLGINYGEFGWALLDINNIDNEYSTIQHAPVLLKYAIKHEDLRPIIDNIIGALFTTEALSRIQNNLNEMLPEEDGCILQDAMQAFSNHEYHTCALLLATMIDSQSMKFMLREYSDEANIPNKETQGWETFAKIITHNYGHYLQLTMEDTKSRTTPRLQFQSKLESCVPSNTEAAHIAFVANVSMAMMRFFANESWSLLHKACVPASINRNWLAHGMYNKYDVYETDCIKLLVLSYQLQTLLLTIRFDGVKEKLPDNTGCAECLKVESTS